MADDLSLFGSLVEKGVKLYDKTQDRSKLPANQRVFLESTLDNVKTPITQGVLSKSEQDALKNLIVSRYEPLKGPMAEYKAVLEKKLAEDAQAIKTKNRDRMMYPNFKQQALKDLQAINGFFNGSLTPDFLELASGNTNYERSQFLSQAGLYNAKYGKTGTPFNVPSNIQYSDYNQKNKTEADNTVGAGSTNPEAALRTLLGRFNYSVDPNNNLIINDSYDFNPHPGTGGTEANGGDPEASTDPLYTSIRLYAGEKLPPGKGRVVNMSVPLAPLQYRDPFGEPFPPSIK